MYWVMQPGKTYRGCLTFCDATGADERRSARARRCAGDEWRARRRWSGSSNAAAPVAADGMFTIAGLALIPIASVDAGRQMSTTALAAASMLRPIADRRAGRDGSRD